jgi:hypothetical protein
MEMGRERGVKEKPAEEAVRWVGNVSLALIRGKERSKWIKTRTRKKGRRVAVLGILSL